MTKGEELRYQAMDLAIKSPWPSGLVDTQSLVDRADEIYKFLKGDQ